jgi:Mor family transcriptional regulator
VTTNNAPQEERNRKIIEEYDPDNNVGTRTLAARYGISVQRVKQILRKEEERRNRSISKAVRSTVEEDA